MIKDCAVYRAGERVTGDTYRDDIAAAYAEVDDGAFLWVGLYEPSVEELETVAAVLSLHPLAIEDAVNAHQRPKLERYGSDLFLVLKPLTYDDDTDQVETSEVAVFVGHDYLVTVRHGEAIELGMVRRDLESKSDELGTGPLAVIYGICDLVVDRYQVIVDALQQDVDEVEASVFSDERTQDSQRIYTLKREVMEVRRAALPLRPPLHTFATGTALSVPDAARPFYRDIADHLDRVSEQVDTLDHLLDTVLDAHMTRVTIQQNEDMRRISAVAALFLAPTLVAGIYGMNFEHMPELHWLLGYPAALVAMVAIVVVLAWRFRKSGWL